MWLEAILSKEDLQRAAAQLFPLRVALGSEGGALSVGAPTEVSLVKDVGLWLVCSGELTWPVLGLTIPVSLRSIALVLEPKVEVRYGVEMLVFEPSLEHADFTHLPDLVDDELTAIINRELVKRELELAWDFKKTLRISFGLPAVLSPHRAMSIAARGGMVRVTEEAVELAISMHADIGEHVAAPLAPVRREGKAPLRPSTWASRWRALGGAGVALALAMMGAGFLMGRLGRRRA